jgi:uncharacterized protein (TIGR00290 family)
MAAMQRLKTILSWSSGKDSAWTLLQLVRDPSVEVVALITTINEAFDRVAMHAVRRELLHAQAKSASLPLWEVLIPNPCSNEQYEIAMKSLIDRATAVGVQACAFGDLFLADVRSYRERQLAGTGLKPLFPLWQRDTTQLAREMIDGGLRARLTCVDPRVLDRQFAGAEFDRPLLAALPQSCDPCGERGEFHTFAYDGPMFTSPIPFRAGEIVERDGFVFADLIPE